MGEVPKGIPAACLSIEINAFVADTGRAFLDDPHGAKALRRGDTGREGGEEAVVFSPIEGMVIEPGFRVQGDSNAACFGYPIRIEDKSIRNIHHRGRSRASCQGA